MYHSFTPLYVIYTFIYVLYTLLIRSIKLVSLVLVTQIKDLSNRKIRI
nr:MAG TPA: hypothetical protein [Caudoviricetes sp.]